jgi:hypothetical protein
MQNVQRKIQRFMQEQGGSAATRMREALCHRWQLILRDKERVLMEWRDGDTWGG